MQTISINVDLGASNNGVFVALCDGDKLIRKDAFNIKFEKNELNFSKIERTSKRHTRRSYDRDRFILRFLAEILPLDEFSQSEKENIYGLFKNRGFNYFNIDFENELEDEPQEVNNYKNYAFKGCESISDFEKIISQKSNELQNKDKMLEFINEQIKIAQEFTQKDKNKNLRSYGKSLVEILNSVENEIIKNNKHRREYLKDIKSEINQENFKNIIKKLDNFNDEKEFYNFVGNISNLQTRVLRRYFTNKAINDLKFDDKKLHKKLVRNLNYMVFSKDEKENEKIMRENLDKFSAFEYLKNTDPNKTIPPYENRKNKNPQECQALLIKPEKISPILKEVVHKILEHSVFERVKINKNGEIQKEILNKELPKFLARILDISKDFLDDDELYPRKLEKNRELFAKELKLNEKQINEFAKFAKNYYDEISQAKKGVILNQLLKPCNKHTPHKNKNKNMLISALFQLDINKKEVIDLESFLRNNKVKGNKTFKGFFEDLAEFKKDKQNKFYYEIKNNENLCETAKLVAEKIKEYNKIFKFELPFDKNNFNTNLNYLSQLGDIIFDDKNRGFLKTCQKCTLENSLRTGGEKAMASRLGANSARLINGKIEAYLNRLTYEITKHIKDFVDINKIEEVQINVEMNKFSFEESAKEIKLSKGKNRNNKEENLICPYTGEKITETSCEYDHILPRSKGLYNSLANLIPASSKGNSDKNNKKYLLENLNENYLENIYKNTKTKNLNEFKNFIDENIKTIDENNFTNFLNLSKNEQIAFRHALFLNENEKSFKKAKDLLVKDRIKAYSNGTQKRFVNLLLEKLHKLGIKENSNKAVSFIDAKAVSATRKELAKLNENLKKKEKQDSHSHCIDASIVYALTNNKNNDEYINEILLNESDIITPTAKKYLELEQEGKSISSKALFDDSVYSLVYENANNLKEKEFKILQDFKLLHIKKDGKKIPLSKEAPRPKKFYISTHKVFEKIFQTFENKNIDILENLKFLDEYLKAYIRKDIFSIFFDKNKLIKPKELDKQPKNIQEFYKILSKEKIYNDKNELDENKIKELFTHKFYPKNIKERKRNKNRVIYSLLTPSSAPTHIIRRNNGFAGIKNKDIAVKTYFDLNENKILSAPFYSKNVLPKKISDIISILDFQKRKTKIIYHLDITKNLPQEIKSLKFIVSQKNRHDVIVEFNKNKLQLKIDENKQEFINEILNGKFKEFLGKPRDNKFDILLDNDEILKLKFCVEGTSKDNKKVIMNELNETSSS